MYVNFGTFLFLCFHTGTYRHTSIYHCCVIITVYKPFRSVLPSHGLTWEFWGTMTSPKWVFILLSSHTRVYPKWWEMWRTGLIVVMHVSGQRGHQMLACMDSNSDLRRFHRFCHLYNCIHLAGWKGLFTCTTSPWLLYLLPISQLYQGSSPQQWWWSLLVWYFLLMMWSFMNERLVCSEI